MSPDFLNTIEVIVNGLMTGVMYSLVALNYVGRLSGQTAAIVLCVWFIHSETETETEKETETETKTETEAEKEKKTKRERKPENQKTRKPESQ